MFYPTKGSPFLYYYFDKTGFKYNIVDIVISVLVLQHQLIELNCHFKKHTASSIRALSESVDEGMLSKGTVISVL